MDDEERRLRTFSSWPTSAAVDPVRVARSGFFSTGRELEVECFACGGRISDWAFGDQVMARHRRLAPGCPFVLDPLGSGNRPAGAAAPPVAAAPPAPPPACVTPEDPCKDTIYKEDMLRLMSFTNWPVSYISPVSLALAGFYYVRGEGGGDRVRCAWCAGELHNWEPEDRPLTEHLRHFPNCSYAKNKARDHSRSPRNNDVLVRSGSSEELGIVRPEAGEAGQQSLEARLQSYPSTWSRPQTPAELAAAGFTYAGPGDRVRCFHCAGGLVRWQPEDDPWKEHARWFPHCGFLLLAKGREFIEQHKLTAGLVSEEAVERCMDSEVAIAALGCGLQSHTIRGAFRKRLQQTGTPFPSTEALIDAALNEQINETPFAMPDSLNPSSMSTRVNVIHENNVESQINNHTQSEAGTPAEEEGEVTLQEENRRLKEARLCKVCMDAEVGVVFLPCGHLLSCVQCAPCLPACPLCRSKVKGIVRTYLS